MQYRNLVFIALLALTGLLVSCEDSNNSSLDLSTEPPKLDVVVNQSYVLFGSQDRVHWNKFNQYGESTLLDDVAGSLATDDGYIISPDTRRMAYWYALDSGQWILKIMQLDGATPERSTVVAGAISQDPWDGAFHQDPAWLPDSTGLVYSVAEAANTFSLYLARADAEDPVPLMRTRQGEQVASFRYTLSADGSKVAVCVNYLGDSANRVSLYLVDPALPGEAQLIDEVTTDAHTLATMSLQWSPYANELLYHASLYGSTGPLPGDPNIPTVVTETPPWMLLTENSDRRTLSISPSYSEGIWLAVDRFLLVFKQDYPESRFDIFDSSGQLLVSHTQMPWSQPIPSPDGKRLAFLDDTALPAVKQVHILELNTGEVRIVGTGSSTIINRIGITMDSELRWSPDGSWLAWNRSLNHDYWSDGFHVGELYAYEVATTQTRLITEELGSSDPYHPLSPLTWLPKGNVLNYLVRADSGFHFTITDLASESTLVVGDMTDFTCPLLRVWPTNEQVLWIRCGDGVYLSRIDNNGSVAQSRLLDQDISNLVLTKNHQLAVMQPVAPTNDNPSVEVTSNWQMYDFTEQRLYEMQGTNTSPCCGSLLQ